MWRWLAVLLLVSTPALADSGFSGVWFGTQPYNANASYLLTISPHGTFLTHHRICAKGREADRFVAGTWALAGDLVTYHVATINGVPRPRVDIFRLVSVDAHRQSTVFLNQNLPYVAQRVPPDFELPSCQLVS